MPYASGKQAALMWYSEIEMMRFGANEQMQSGKQSASFWWRQVDYCERTFSRRLSALTKLPYPSLLKCQ
ncbi:unnamed protein product [Protopolystoma xenopodis]|uniref:Uncharacterized protein n=1 Tax=Protopolystoma xenopodis TaxID=117903 RepID=A0A3S4ZYL6_9PLAT|nr:unnamed protein product [Protopolystoma xenopodis]